MKKNTKNNKNVKRITKKNMYGGARSQPYKSSTKVSVTEGVNYGSEGEDSEWVHVPKHTPSTKNSTKSSSSYKPTANVLTIHPKVSTLLRGEEARSAIAELEFKKLNFDDLKHKLLYFNGMMINLNKECFEGKIPTNKIIVILEKYNEIYDIIMEIDNRYNKIENSLNNNKARAMISNIKGMKEYHKYLNNKTIKTKTEKCVVTFILENIATQIYKNIELLNPENKNKFNETLQYLLNNMYLWLNKLNKK